MKIKDLGFIEKKTILIPKDEIWTVDKYFLLVSNRATKKIHTYGPFDSAAEAKSHATTHGVLVAEDV